MIGFPKLRAQSAELLHLDLTRLIASVGIVAHHSIEFFAPVPNREWLSEQTMGLALFVDLFFVISGFIIAFVYHERALSLKGYLKFMQRRAGRLIPLHWLTLLGSFVIWSAFVLLGYGGNHPPSFRPECIAEAITLIHSFVSCGDGNSFYGTNSFNGVSWSISTEMVMYVLVFPAIALAAVRNRYIPAVAGAVIFALLVWFDLENNPAPAGSWVEIHPVLRAMPSFFLGAALYYNRDLVISLPAPKTVFTVSLVTLLLLMVLGASHLIALVAVYIVATSAVAADLDSRPSSFVRKYGSFGQLTYSIYMWHGLFILVLMNAVGDKLLHARPLAMALLAVICWACIFFTSYISLLYVENPARRWIDGLGTPGRA